MAVMNFIEAVNKGYLFAWNERRDLARYALWPVVLKISLFMIIVSLGYEKNILRQGLILLPSFFFEGWLVALSVRFALFNERVPEPLNGRDLSPAALERRRMLLGAIIIYMLTRLVSSLAGGLTMGMETMQPVSPQAPTAGMFFAMMLVLGALIWAFRLMWLYIPVLLGCPVSFYLKRLEGMGTSFYMLGIWFVSMLPLILVTILIARGLLAVFPGDPAASSIMYAYALAVVQSVAETVIAIVSSVAMAYGVQSVLMYRDEKKSW